MLNLAAGRPVCIYRPAKFQLVAICLFKAIVKFDLIILHSEPGLFFKSICIWELLQQMDRCGNLETQSKQSFILEEQYSVV